MFPAVLTPTLVQKVFVMFLIDGTSTSAPAPASTHMAVHDDSIDVPSCKSTCAQSLPSISPWLQHALNCLMQLSQLAKDLDDRLRPAMPFSSGVDSL